MRRFEPENDLSYYTTRRHNKKQSDNIQIQDQRDIEKDPQRYLNPYQETLESLKAQLSTAKSHNLFSTSFPYEAIPQQSNFLKSYVQDWINKMNEDGQPIQLFMQAINSSLKSYSDKQWFDKHMTVTLAALKKRSIKPKLILPRMYIESDEKEVKDMVKEIFLNSFEGNKKLLKQVFYKNYFWTNGEENEVSKNIVEWENITKQINKNDLEAINVRHKFLNHDDSQQLDYINGVIFRNNEMKNNVMKYGDTLYLIQYRNKVNIPVEENTLDINPTSKHITRSFILNLVFNKQSLPLIGSFCIFQSVNEPCQDSKHSENIIKLFIRKTLSNSWLGETPKSIIHYTHNISRGSIHKYHCNLNLSSYQPIEVEEWLDKNREECNRESKMKPIKNQSQYRPERYEALDHKNPHIFIVSIPITILNKTEATINQEHPTIFSQQFLPLYNYLIMEILNHELNLFDIFITSNFSDIYKTITFFIKIHKVLQFRYRSEIQFQDYTQYEEQEQIKNCHMNYQLEGKYHIDRNCLAAKTLNKIKDYYKSYRIAVAMYELIKQSDKFVLESITNENYVETAANKNREFYLKYICKGTQGDQSYAVCYDQKSQNWMCQCGFIYVTGLPCCHLIRVVNQFEGSILYYVNQKYRYQEIKTMGIKIGASQILKKQMKYEEEREIQKQAMMAKQKDISSKKKVNRYQNGNFGEDIQEFEHKLSNYRTNQEKKKLKKEGYF